MTHAKNSVATEKEACLQESITAVLKKEHTCHSDAITFNVHHHTLYDHVNGNKTACNLAHEGIKS